MQQRNGFWMSGSAPGAGNEAAATPDRARYLRLHFTVSRQSGNLSCNRKQGQAGTPGTGLFSCDIGTQSLQPLVDVLVAAVNLVDVLDDAGAFSAQSRDKQSHTGTDVG